MTCTMVKPRATQPQKLGNLPTDRITLLRPFLNSGVDYCDPFNIKFGSRSTSKAFVALFVCMATKAVHLELVGNLTTAAFLNALKPYQGAVIFPNSIVIMPPISMLITEMDQEQIETIAQIKWELILPRSLNFGGIWEAGVKSVKFHLKRVIRKTVLSFKKFYTILTRFEAILNSRPLTSLSSDSNDFEAITPGHFLIGDTLTANVEPYLIDITTNRFSRWQQVEQMRQQYWKRWSREYLPPFKIVSSGKETFPTNSLLEPLCYSLKTTCHLCSGKWEK